MSIPEFDRSRLAWWAFGGTVAAALAYVVYSFVGTVVFGIFLYYATRPVYERIRRRVGNRTLAAAVSLVALAGPALALVGYAVVRGLTQAQRFVDALQVVPLDQIPGLDRATVQSLSDPETLLALDWTEYVTRETLSSTLDSVTGAADLLAFFGVGLLHLFVMFVIAFYLLRDGHKLRRWFTRFGDDRGVTQAYVSAVDTDYKNIFFGNILNAAFTGTIGVVAYSAMNLFAPPGAAVPAAALVGLLAGVASLVPVVGMKLVYVPVALFMGLRAIATGATETAWFVAAFVAVSFVIVDTVPDLLLRPYVSGRSLHVGSVMLAYTLGPLLFGWYGIFLLPMLLVVAVQFARIVMPELVAGREVRPASVDPGSLADLPPAGGPSEEAGSATDGGRAAAEAGDAGDATNDQSIDDTKRDDYGQSIDDTRRDAYGQSADDTKRDDYGQSADDTRRDDSVSHTTGTGSSTNDATDESVSETTGSGPANEATDVDQSASATDESSDDDQPRSTDGTTDESSDDPFEYGDGK